MVCLSCTCLSQLIIESSYLRDELLEDPYLGQEVQWPYRLMQQKNSQRTK